MKSFVSLRVWGATIVVNLILFIVASKVAAQPSVVPSLTVNAPGLGIATTHAPANSAFQLAADGKSWELKPGNRFFIPGAPFVDVVALRFDPDPLVYGNILVQNNTAATQNYLLGFSIPATFAGPNLIRGSIDTSIIGTAGQISTVSAFPIYSAQIDSVTVHTLQNAPFTLTTPQGAVSSSAQFGFNLSNIPVSTSIGILLQFQLSPGDTATIVSDFEVVAVPEPSIMTLAFLGACLLAYRRHRT
jgi:hypothetical protein